MGIQSITPIILDILLCPYNFDDAKASSDKLGNSIIVGSISKMASRNASKLRLIVACDTQRI